MQHEGVGFEFEQLHSHVVWRANTGRAKADGARFGFDLTDQVGNRLDACLGVRYQHQRTIGSHGHSRKIFDWVKAGVFVHLRCHEHGVGAHQNGVAVGIRFGYGIGTNVAAGAGLVLHHHGLAQFFR